MTLFPFKDPSTTFSIEWRKSLDCEGSAGGSRSAQTYIWTHPPERYITDQDSCNAGVIKV